MLHNCIKTFLIIFSAVLSMLKFKVYPYSIVWLCYLIKFKISQVSFKDVDILGLKMSSLDCYKVQFND